MKKKEKPIALLWFTCELDTLEHCLTKIYQGNLTRSIYQYLIT